MPSDTPDSPDAGGVFSGASAHKPPEAENLPGPFGGRPAHVPSDAIRREVEMNAAALIPQEDIAALVGARETPLRKHCLEGWARGEAKAWNGDPPPMPRSASGADADARRAWWSRGTARTDARGRSVHRGPSPGQTGPLPANANRHGVLILKRMVGRSIYNPVLGRHLRAPWAEAQIPLPAAARVDRASARVAGPRHRSPGQAHRPASDGAQDGASQSPRPPRSSAWPGAARAPSHELRGRRGSERSASRPTGRPRPSPPAHRDADRTDATPGPAFSQPIVFRSSSLGRGNSVLRSSPPILLKPSHPSVAWRSSVRERSPSPMTRFQRPMSASAWLRRP